ncbi:MAG: hypothetical protein IPF57_07685 [Gammaproteobacteria bacterium]|nr:hypothetical protein [Gammaproteobacteria bacterium]
MQKLKALRARRDNAAVQVALEKVREARAPAPTPGRALPGGGEGVRHARRAVRRDARGLRVHHADSQTAGV